MTENHLSCAGVAQLGEQQTEARSILEVPCSIHGPGIFYRSSTQCEFFCIYRVLSRNVFSLLFSFMPYPDLKILVMSRAQYGDMNNQWSEEAQAIAAVPNFVQRPLGLYLSQARRLDKEHAESWILAENIGRGIRASQFHP
jgi:hypothetical protein